jgi:hypothetical protein
MPCHQLSAIPTACQECNLVGPTAHNEVLGPSRLCLWAAADGLPVPTRPSTPPLWPAGPENVPASTAIGQDYGEGQGAGGRQAGAPKHDHGEAWAREKAEELKRDLAEAEADRVVEYDVRRHQQQKQGRQQ